MNTFATKSILFGIVLTSLVACGELETEESSSEQANELSGSTQAETSLDQTPATENDDQPPVEEEPSNLTPNTPPAENPMPDLETGSSNDEPANQEPASDEQTSNDDPLMEEEVVEEEVVEEEVVEEDAMVDEAVEQGDGTEENEVVVETPVNEEPEIEMPVECPIGMHLNQEGNGCLDHVEHTGQLPLVDRSKEPVFATGSSTVDIKPQSYSPDQKSDNTGDFRIGCDFSHMSNDDPIVYPNQQGAAHHHTFFGNTETNYLSTPESIRTSGNSTCHGGIVNRSAYWVPSMIDTSSNTPLEPSLIIVYYKTQLASQINYMPEGLRMIARPTDVRPTTQFMCNEVYETRKVLEIPSCNQGGAVQVSIDFPNCWDGQNLDSANHEDHMAYTVWSDERL